MEIESYRPATLNERQEAGEETEMPVKEAAL